MNSGRTSPPSRIDVALGGEMRLGSVRFSRDLDRLQPGVTMLRSRSASPFANAHGAPRDTEHESPSANLIFPGSIQPRRLNENVYFSVFLSRITFHRLLRADFRARQFAPNG